jgi:23S rRNA (cytidine1920-2'-O)/16S rRNA (cytidine1409-2'-O)-methyltransferase
VDPGGAVRMKIRSPAYASRGGLKLAGAFQGFEIGIDGRVAIDVGASTGGFTDYLLSRGARIVYAVDVGYGQLDWRLRQDERVVVFEKTNIRYLQPEALSETPDLAVVDVSFISLRLVLPRVHVLVAPLADVVALIKPQFEVGKGMVGKGGVVRSPAEHERVVNEVRSTAEAFGFVPHGVLESPLLGPKGNKEFFIHLRSAP